MTCTQAILTLLLISPCSDGGGSTPQAYVTKAVHNEARPQSDRDRDATRHPAEVLTFFGIKPGMNVLDLFAGGGYYTEILSGVVGNSGSVTSHNNQAYLDYAAKELVPRFTEGRLKNVNRVTAEAAELELPKNSFDAALAILTWHDFYYVDPENGWVAIDEPALTAKLCAALKPGAVLGVVDHVAVAGSDTNQAAQNLHRIDPERIKSDLADSCFEFDGEMELLRNPEDDHTKPMFDPAVRGKTDRVVYRFRHK